MYETTNRNQSDVVVNASDAYTRWAFVSVASVCAILNLMSLFIMLQTKRLHFAIKTICLNIIFYDVLFLLSEIVFQSVSVSEHPTVKLQVSIICRYSVRTSWYMAMFLSVERLIALDYPYMYRKYLTKRTVRLYMSFVFIVLVGCIIFRILYVEMGVKNAEWSYTCWTTNGFILTCGTITICCYSRVLVFCKKQLKHVEHTGRKLRTMKSTYFFLLITGSFILTHTPVVVESIIHRCNMHLELESYTFSLIFLYCTLNPVIYIWRFSACRLVFLMYIKKYTKCVTIPNLDNRIVKLRIEIYDIVLSASSTVHPSRQPRNATRPL